MIKFNPLAGGAKTQNKLSLGCLVAFLFPFFAVGIGTFTFGVWGAYQGLASKSWTKVPGIITQSEVEAHSGSKGGTTYGAKIHYTYAWDGQTLEGDRVQTSVPVSTSGGGNARETVARYAVGKKVDVFVNPENPKKAVLEAGLGWSHLFLPLFGLAFGGMASLFLCLGIWGRRKQAAAEAAKGAFGKIDLGQETEQGPEGVEWGPFAGGGANFQTSRLKEQADGTLKVVPTVGMWLFAGLFGAIGVGVPTLFLCVLTVGGSGGKGVPWWVKLIPVGFGLIFTLASVAMIRAAMNGPSFDLQSQTCRRLFAKKAGGGQRVDVSFSEVQGIQLVSQQNSGSGDSSGYVSYQINLVMKDGSRAHVMGHGNLPALEADAKSLAQLLRVPLWKRV